MKEAFFADKIPQYFKEIANGSRKLAWFENVRKMLKRDCKKYHVSAIMAHNMRFRVFFFISILSFLRLVSYDNPCRNPYLPRGKTGAFHDVHASR